MDRKRKLMIRARFNKKLRFVDGCNTIRVLIAKNSNDQEYMADIVQLRKSLERIEKELYSSNIRFEQIEKKRHSKIIMAQAGEIFLFRKMREKRIKLKHDF